MAAPVDVTIQGRRRTDRPRVVPPKVKGNLTQRMNTFVATSIAAMLMQLAFAGPASADTVTLPHGGTATLIIPDVTLAPEDTCVNHYGSLTVTSVYDWDIDITANGPSTSPASDYLDGEGSQTRVVDLLLCPSLDQPGVYTASGLLSVYDASDIASEVLLSDQFVINDPMMTVPPTVLPVLTPVVTSDVTGTVTRKKVTNGVRLAFRSDALPAGTVAGDTLTWTVLVDRKVRKTFSQGPDAVRKLKIASSDRSGRHVVKVLRNGRVVKSVTYRA